MHDLSVTGARFLCERVFLIGGSVDLELVLPLARDPIPVSARVVWTKPAQAQLGLWEYGVEFPSLDPAAAALITQSLSPVFRRAQAKPPRTDDA